MHINYLKVHINTRIGLIWNFVLVDVTIEGLNVPMTVGSSFPLQQEHVFVHDNRPNHLLHFIITLFFPLWIFVWLLVCLMYGLWWILLSAVRDILTVCYWSIIEGKFTCYFCIIWSFISHWLSFVTNLCVCVCVCVCVCFHCKELCAILNANERP